MSSLLIATENRRSSSGASATKKKDGQKAKFYSIKCLSPTKLLQENPIKKGQQIIHTVCNKVQFDNRNVWLYLSAEAESLVLEEDGRLGRE